jgi:hypothetical protein
MSDSIPHARITVSVAAGVASVEIDNPSQPNALTKAIGNYSAQGEIAWGKVTSLPRLHGEPQIRRVRATRVDDV